MKVSALASCHAVLRTRAQIGGKVELATLSLIFLAADRIFSKG